MSFFCKLNYARLCDGCMDCYGEQREREYDEDEDEEADDDDEDAEGHADCLS